MMGEKAANKWSNADDDRWRAERRQAADTLSEVVDVHFGQQKRKTKLIGEQPTAKGITNEE